MDATMARRPASANADSRPQAHRQFKRLPYVVPVIIPGADAWNAGIIARSAA